MGLRLTAVLIGALLFLAQHPARAQDTAAATVSAEDRALSTAVRRQSLQESLEMSKLVIEERQRQGRLEEMRLQRAAREDAHILFTLYKQSVTDVIIFIVVMTMTVAGVYMSYLQFRKGLGDLDTLKPVLAPRDGAAQPQGAEDAKAAWTQFKIGLSGIEMSSSIIGLLVLVVSLAFFYLYLDRVYAIRVIAEPAAVEKKLG